MHIERLEIKGFGKVEKFTLELQKGLNIVYGSNESGKTTLLWFIKGMLYGLKGGRASREGILPPLKKYKPWKAAAYGGAMTYTLDNGSYFRIDRDFEKNTVNIHDAIYNEISNSFDFSKEKGPLFSEKHLGINEACFDRTVMVRQMETRFDEDGGSDLINRLMNLSRTGFEDLSFKKAEDALKGALLMYAGTERTTVQPIDRLNARLEGLRKSKGELLEKRNAFIAISNQLQNAAMSHTALCSRKEYLEKVRELIECRKQMDDCKERLRELAEAEKAFGAAEMELARVVGSQNIVSEDSNAVNQQKRYRKPHGLLHYGNAAGIILAVLLVSVVGAFFTGLLYNHIGYIFSAFLLLGGGIFVLYLRSSNKASDKSLGLKSEKKIRQEYEQKMQEMQALNGKLKDISNKTSVICGRQIENARDLREGISVIEEDIKELELKLQTGIDTLNTTYRGMRSDFFAPPALCDIMYDANPSWMKDSWEYEMEKTEEALAESALNVKEFETKLAGTEAEEGDLQSVEEEIASLEQKRLEFDRIGSSLRLALEVLKETASEIQRNYAPRLNLLMSTIISGVTGGRYNDLKADDMLLLKTVSPDSEDIKSVMALSGGSVDQMYLALRLAMAELISQDGEGLPLILDEVFSQYDDDRTAKTLKYLSEKYTKGQVILFTCKSREIDIARAVSSNRLNLIEI